MFSTERYISFSDCDPAGIMFFSRAFEIVHIAYEKFLFKNDLGGFFEGKGIIIPLVHAEADYKIPLKAGMTVIVMVKLGEIKENSFSLAYNIYDSENRIAAKVKTVHVVVSAETQTKCEVPDNLKNALLKLEL